MAGLIFIGTNVFAKNILNKLIIKNINIKLIITKSYYKTKYNNKLKFSHVCFLAKRKKKKIIETKDINNKNIINKIKDLKPEIILITDYGEKLKHKIIRIPKYGIWNIHPSILPKFKGPTPIQNVLIKNKKITGVSIIKINEKFDSGCIIKTKKIKIKNTDTYSSLIKKLSKLGCLILLKTIKKSYNKIIKINQNTLKKHQTKKFKKNEIQIFWYNSAVLINKKIKAFKQKEKLNIKLNNNKIKIIKTKVIKKYFKNTIKPGTILKKKSYGIDIATGKFILRISYLQIPGKNINKIKNIINSNQLFKKGKILI